MSMPIASVETRRVGCADSLKRALASEGGIHHYFAETHPLRVEDGSVKVRRERFEG